MYVYVAVVVVPKGWWRWVIFIIIYSYYKIVATVALDTQ